MFSRATWCSPTRQGLRIVAKNSMLWVMFLACMATSVFFSFDSRFNVIFPKDQRERAAEIRTKNQVAGVCGRHRRHHSEPPAMTEAEHLFQSDGWKAYDGAARCAFQSVRGRRRPRSRTHFTKPDGGSSPVNRAAAGAHGYGDERRRRALPAGRRR